jgi:hypothetical protein
LAEVAELRWAVAALANAQVVGRAIATASRRFVAPVPERVTTLDGLRRVLADGPEELRQWARREQAQQRLRLWQRAAAR